MITNIMKILYANENYSKYGIPGMNYFIALAGGSFYIVLTGFMIFEIVMALFPFYYRQYLNTSMRIPSLLSATLITGSTFLFLRVSISEKSLVDDSFTKQRVKRMVTYLLAYGLLVVIVTGFIGLHYLVTISNHLGSNSIEIY
jgi:hypothetical protein